VAPTAIIVPVPEAAAAVDGWRLRYTEAAPSGLPPHVTLLFPFGDDAALTPEHAQAVRDLLSSFPPFDFALQRFGPLIASPSTGTVLYLAPDPAEPFAAMTQALADAFPDYPPYAGEFAELVPHLTVALGDDVPADEIRADVKPRLPIRAHAFEAQLMGLTSGRWQTRGRILLAG
jgi:2'-5' RNA ligase